MGGPGEEFSRGQGGHRLWRGPNELTQPCTQGPVGERPHSHPDTYGHLCSKKFCARDAQSPREGVIILSGLDYLMWKYTAISSPFQVPSSIPCPSCAILCPALPLISPESRPLTQSSQPLSSPKTPWLPMLHSWGGRVAGLLT